MGCNSCGKASGLPRLFNPSKVIKGAIGLTKAALHIERAEVDIINKRRDACRNCEFSTKTPKFINNSSKGLTNKSLCEKCGCFIMAKTTLKNEVCPEGKWN